MARTYPYQYKGKWTTKQDRCRASMPLDKARIWLDFNGFCAYDEKGEIYLFSKADIVNDSDGNDVELHEGMEVSVFDYDLDEFNKPDAILAEGIIVKNMLAQHPNEKWLIRLIRNKENYKSGNKYVYWMSDLYNTNNKRLGENYMCKMYEEYEYKIAMYIWEGYTTFFQLKEQENGHTVPIRRLSRSPREVSYWGSVETAIRVAESLQKCNSKKNCPQGLNIYPELMGISSLSKEAIDNEMLFWKNVICIHFYRKPNGEYTIVALQRGDDLYNYIKKIHIHNNYLGSEFQDVVLELIQKVHNYRENPVQTPINIEEYLKCFTR